MYISPHHVLLTLFQYPEGLREYEYIPNFVVRGLHYDVQKVRGLTFLLCSCDVSNVMPNCCLTNV